jgi:hypothetical protein
MGYANAWERKLSRLRQDPILAKRLQDMEKLHETIKILMELGEEETAYELRVLHEKHLLAVPGMRGFIHSDINA